MLEILFLNLPLPESMINDYDEEDEDAMEITEGVGEGNIATDEVCFVWGRNLPN